MRFRDCIGRQVTSWHTRPSPSTHPSHATLRRSRRSGGPSFIDALASKYGVNPSGDPEPSEEEFAAAAARHRDRAAGQGFRGAAKKRQKAG